MLASRNNDRDRHQQIIQNNITLNNQETRSTSANYDKKSDEGSNSARMRHENFGSSAVVEK